MAQILGPMATSGPRQRFMFPKRVFTGWSMSDLWKTLRAIPICAAIAVEFRDLKEKSKWEAAPIAPNAYRTGDVVLVSNRWYQLPTWGDSLYCLGCKLVMRSAWDDVGVIVMLNGKPNILHANAFDVEMMPLGDFVDLRCPRALCLRTLDPTHSVAPLVKIRETKEGEERALELAKELIGKPTFPLDIIRAGRRSGKEYSHWDVANRFSKQHADLIKFTLQKHSVRAVQRETQYLRDLALSEEDLGNYAGEARPNLANGSVVATYLASLGLVPPQRPVLWKYLPSDFTVDIPTLDSRLGEPRIVFVQ